MSVYEPQNNLIFHFQFVFPEGLVQQFSVKLDARTLNLIDPQRETYPEWAALSYCQCPHCPLSEEQYPACPIAVSLSDIILTFKESISYEHVEGLD